MVEKSLLASQQVVNFEFLDRRIVEDTWLLDRKVTQLTKYEANPIIKSGHRVSGVIKENELIRMWYVGRDPISGEPPHSPGMPSTKPPHGRIPLGEKTLRYAESTDGFHWKLPELELVEFRGSKKNNILIKRDAVDKNGKKISGGKGSPGMGWRGPAEPSIIKTESTPYSRGKYTLFTVCIKGFSYSDDGLVWTAYEENPFFDLLDSDTHNNFFYDKRINKYVLFHRPHENILAGDRRANRLMARIESTDLVHWDWESARCVLSTDERDGPAVPRVVHPGNIYKTRGRDVQIESMTVVPYRDLYLGFTGIFDNANKGLYDTHLVHSYDGINWMREPNSIPFIPLSKFGTWDSGIASPPLGPVSVGDKLFFYYMGSNMSHEYKMMTKDKLESRNIGVGYILKGRFVGYHAGEYQGEILTRPFLLTKKYLTVNANVKDGILKVGIARVDGKREGEHAKNSHSRAESVQIKGFSQKDCIPVTMTDGIQIPLSWKGKKDLSELLNKKIRLRISVKNGAVFGFGMSKLLT